MGFRFLIGVLAQQVVFWMWAVTFGSRWEVAAGRTAPDLASTDTLISFAISTAYVLTFQQLVQRLQIKDWRIGARLGTYVGVVFGFGTLATHYARLGLSIDVLWLDGGSQVVTGFITGIVLTFQMKQR